ncbi:MAG TPA: LacI family DNA-binding transcriptional regulator, partial [Phnomibacter sp.]|nr:LacI family DNA-binding transcriptional regulator [Phnomibacter sp.]
MNSLPTLKKISEHLNISVSTVSRALKDHPDVSAETIRRVKELANLMEYEPNGFAVNLRKRKSETYAILVPEISGYFYHSFIQAVEEEARKQGFGVMIMQSMDDPKVEAENLRICRYNHVAGVFAAITSSTTDLSPFHKTMDFEIPVVFFDKVPETGSFPCITMPDEEAAAIAARRSILSDKAKTLCLLGDPSLSITRHRRSGFENVYLEAGRPLPEVCHLSHEEAAFAFISDKGMKELDDTAIFCMSDQILCGAMRALYKLGTRIPAQVAIIALSNGFMPRFF